jgi:hypothetical protein
VGPQDEPPQGSGRSGEDAGSPGDEAGRDTSGGSMRSQDRATARPRPPTVGETRAREKAERKRREIEKARVDAELKRQQRNKRLKGGVVAVGVVGVVAALGYWALSPRTVTAQCVQEDASGGPIVVPDSYCTGHTGNSSGLFIYSGHQYRYYYGGSGTVGARPVGGTTIKPKDTTVKTSSGSTIERGGLGSKFSGSGGG